MTTRYLVLDGEDLIVANPDGWEYNIATKGTLQGNYWFAKGGIDYDVVYWDGSRAMLTAEEVKDLLDGWYIKEHTQVYPFTIIGGEPALSNEEFRKHDLPNWLPETYVAFESLHALEEDIEKELASEGAELSKLVEESLSNDPVHKPSHYTSGTKEVIDTIHDALTPEEFSGAMKFNVLKYSLRSELKGGSEDLQKAKQYLDFLDAHLYGEWEDGVSGRK
jgi:hypothetical protein